MKKLFFALFFLIPHAVFGMDPQAVLADESDGLYDYELFKIVQQIHNLVDQARSDAEEIGTTICICKDLWPWLHQTKRGLFLEDSKAIWTPWGIRRLTCGGDGSSMGFCLFEQKLLEKMKVRFFRISKDKAFFEEDDLKPTYKVRSQKYSIYEEEQKVSEKELEAMVGDEVFVSSSLCGYDPVYSVHAVEGRELPTPELLEYGRNAEAVRKAWDIMEARYRAELGRQG